MNKANPPRLGQLGESTDNDDPVTVLARYSVRAGCQSEFERWIEGIVSSCKTFEGYLGTEVIRPVSDSRSEFVAIFRFDTYAHLERWMESGEREDWLAKTGRFSDARPQMMDYHSLEFWFSPERHEGRAPPRYKMALVTFLALWPLVHFIPPALGQALDAPLLLVETTGLATIVLLMTFIVMPAATRLLEAWLHPRHRD